MELGHGFFAASIGYVWDMWTAVGRKIKGGLDAVCAGLYKSRALTWLAAPKLWCSHLKILLLSPGVTRMSKLFTDNSHPASRGLRTLKVC